jgi:hypothetical protein
VDSHGVGQNLFCLHGDLLFGLGYLRGNDSRDKDPRPVRSHHPSQSVYNNMEWRLAVNSFTDVLFESVYIDHATRGKLCQAGDLQRRPGLRCKAPFDYGPHFAPSNQVFLHTVGERQISYFRNGLMQQRRHRVRRRGAGIRIAPRPGCPLR